MMNDDADEFNLERFIAVYKREDILATVYSYLGTEVLV